MIRVRFAPSPTGHLHIGGLRAAIFNYLYAKKHNGIFLLRIEDTDTERNRDEFTEAIKDAFLWCNIQSDEPLVFQSQRLHIYKEYINKLINSGFGYYADEPDANGTLGKVIKCKIPEREYITFNDKIRGEVSFSTKDLEDFIIVRSDGMPLYNLVVVIDDILMNISHIIRGEEHLSNTPRQLILYEAFGATPPVFAHLPLILGPDGKKLSKRDAATSVIDYKKMGFLPEALCNYLIRLGWSHKDQEIFSFDDVIPNFDFDSINSSGAMFDMQKLLWVNNTYIKKTSSQKLLKILKNNFNLNIQNSFNEEQYIQLIELLKERSNTILELKESIIKLINAPIEYDTKKPEFIEIVKPLELMLEELKNIISESSFSEDDLKTRCSIFAVKYNYKMPQILKTIRFILFNTFETPSIYNLINILQKNEVLKRFNNYLIQNT